LVFILAVSAYLGFLVGPAGTVALIVDARRHIVFYHSLEGFLSPLIRINGRPIERGIG
jgi:hypothetical protein